MSVPRNLCASCPPRASCFQHAAVTLPCSPPRPGNLPHLPISTDPRLPPGPFCAFRGARSLSLPSFRDLIWPSSVSFSCSCREEHPIPVVRRCYVGPGHWARPFPSQHAARCPSPDVRLGIKPQASGLGHFLASVMIAVQDSPAARKCRLPRIASPHADPRRYCASDNRLQSAAERRREAVPKNRNPSGETVSPSATLQTQVWHAQRGSHLSGHLGISRWTQNRSLLFPRELT